MAIPHIHFRKRQHAKKKEKLEPYPHPDKKIQLLDSVTMVIALIWPAMFIPQVHDIYTTHNASGINIYSFVISCILVLPWIAYGIVHREKAIWIGNILWLMIYSLIAVGAYLYG